MADIKKIICAVDLTDPIVEVSDYARSMAKYTGAKIIAVFAIPVLAPFSRLHIAPESIDQFLSIAKNNAGKLMTDFMTKHFADVDAQPVIGLGAPAEVILKQAKQENADLIIMGTRGNKGINRLLLGSVAEKVVKNAECPVTTIRAKAAD